jgi:hypothetical protein
MDSARAGHEPERKGNQHVVAVVVVVVVFSFVGIVVVVSSW